VDGLRKRVQVRAAVRVHDALRTSGRPARVVDTDRVVLRLKPVLRLAVFGGSQELLVVAALAADENALDRSAGDEVSERFVDHERARTAVAQDVGDLVGGQPGVDRHQHSARRGHAVVRLEQLGRVRRQEGDPVASLDPALLKSDGKTPGALAQLAPGQATVAVDDGHTCRKGSRTALEKRNRRESGQMDALRHSR